MVGGSRAEGAGEAAAANSTHKFGCEWAHDIPDRLARIITFWKGHLLGRIIIGGQNGLEKARGKGIKLHDFL